MTVTRAGTGRVSGSEMLLRLGEILNQQAIKPNINGYVPHPKQIAFHQSTAKTRLYVGGNRSGKTYGNVAECVFWLRGQHPYQRLPKSEHEPCRGRFNTVDFLNGVEKIALPLFKQLIPPSLLINGSWDDSYHKASRVLTLSNDAFCEFLSYEQELDKFAGTSRHFIAYDEEPPETIYSENRARLIDTGGHQWFSMTPVEGMAWTYDAIYMKAKAGVSGFFVVEIAMDENPHLRKEEIDEYLNGLDENERLARGQGKYVEMAGLIYKGFDPTVGGRHVLDRERMRFPGNVPVGISLDHGLNNPTAVLWHAMLPEGKIITFHEHYVRGEVVGYHAEAIKKFNRVNRIVPSILVADPSIRNRDPITGTSIQEEYSKHGIYWTLGVNDVQAGISRVSSYLKGRLGDSDWKVTKDCENLIREMQRYRWAKFQSKKVDARHNLREEPNKKDDHACDSLRYFIMSRPDLGSEFDQANPRVRELDFNEWETQPVRSDDSVWTVKRIRDLELEQAVGSEYVQSSGYDQLGGIW